MHLCCHLLPTGVGDPTSTIRLEDSIMDSLPRPWRSVHDGNPRFESSNAHRPGRGLVLRSRFTVAKSDTRIRDSSGSYLRGSIFLAKFVSSASTPNVFRRFFTSLLTQALGPIRRVGLILLRVSPRPWRTRHRLSLAVEHRADHGRNLVGRNSG